MAYSLRLPVLVSAIFVLEALLVFGQGPTPTPAPTTTTTSKPSADNDTCVGVNLNYSGVKPNTSEVFDFCAACVATLYEVDNTTHGCWFFETSLLQQNYICATASKSAEGANNSTDSFNACRQKYSPGPTPTPITTSTTTTTKPTTTTPANATTTAAPNVTTSTTAPPVTPTTAIPGGNSTLSPEPAPTTVPPQPASGGSFSFANFLGGIVFTLAISSLAYVVWKFYKARTERNYHTF